MFNMDDAKSLSTSMISKISTDSDPNHPCKDKEEECTYKTCYLATIGALLYLTTFTKPDISFIVSVMARHSQKTKPFNQALACYQVYLQIFA